MECIEKETNINLYTDPEFAALMWQEVESDDTFTQSTEEVNILILQKGDTFEVEWLGFEMVDEERVTSVRMVQKFGGPFDVTLRNPMVDCTGWIPDTRFKLKEGTQDGIRITRIQ